MLSYASMEYVLPGSSQQADFRMQQYEARRVGADQQSVDKKQYRNCLLQKCARVVLCYFVTGDTFLY